MRKRKRNRSWTTPEKEDTWNFDEVEDFLNVILLVVISKYRTNFLLQSVNGKFSWCEKWTAYMILSIEVEDAITSLHFHSRRRDSLIDVTEH